MLKKNLFSLFLVIFVLVGFTFGADTYAVDSAHSNVNFAVKHLVISKVNGKFKEFTGAVLFDEKDITKSSVTGSIKVASINTENEDRDNDLRSANFFDAAKYPEITFRSTKVEKEGDRVLVTGDLAIHGVTKSVTFPVTISGPIKDPWGNQRIGIEISLNIDRQEYGITYGKRMDSGGLVVGNDVDIYISAEGIKK